MILPTRVIRKQMVVFMCHLWLPLTTLVVLHAQAQSISLQTTSTAKPPVTGTVKPTAVANAPSNTSTWTTVRVSASVNRFNTPQATNMSAFLSKWASNNNINISTLEANTYEEYITAVKANCLAGRGVSDVIWFQPQHLGYLAPCLYPIDYSSSVQRQLELDRDILNTGIVNGTLYALPAEIYTNVLYYNSDKLAMYNFNNPPVTMDDLESISEKIIIGERAADNFLLSGLAGAFAGPSEDLNTIAEEWIRASNSSIFSADGKTLTVATDTVAQLLERISRWVVNGIIDVNDLSDSNAGHALNRFLNGQSIFLHAPLSAYDEINRNAVFQWNVTGLPTNGVPQSISIINGWYVGVSRFSTVKPAAMQVATFLASTTYQRQSILAHPGIPFFPGKSALCKEDEDIAAHLTPLLCQLYAASNIGARSTDFVGDAYPAYRSYLSTLMANVMSGQTDVIPALQTFDSSIRRVLKMPLGNYTITLPSSAGGSGGKSKKFESSTAVQFLCLVMSIAIGCTVVFLVRQKEVAKKALEELATRDTLLAAKGGEGEEVRVQVLASTPTIPKRASTKGGYTMLNERQEQVVELQSIYRTSTLN